jgi:hypothetical protein
MEERDIATRGAEGEVGSTIAANNTMREGKRRLWCGLWQIVGCDQRRVVLNKRRDPKMMQESDQLRYLRVEGLCRVEEVAGKRS